MEKQKLVEGLQPVNFDSANPIKIPSNLPSNKHVSLKFDTLLWLIASVVTLYYSDVIHVLRTHSLTNGYGEHFSMLT